MDTNTNVLSLTNNTNLNDQALSWILTLSIVLGVMLILFITMFILKKVNTAPKIKIDENFLNKFLIGIGGKENILETSIDNGRLKFKINNLKLLDTDSLKEISQSGVFITGNHVKLLFKYDSKDIKTAIEKL